MANIKLVLNDPKTGRSGQMETNEDVSKKLRTMKVGDTFKGEVLDFTGYEFKITGGSDHAGFPLRGDLPGTGRRKILTKDNVVGVKKGDRAGRRVRKTVCAQSIDANTVQVNAMVIKAGKAPIEVLQEKKEEAPAEGEAPAEEKKE